MDDLNEKIKRVFADLGIRCAYNMPSFWANDGKDYKVIPTRYAKGYQKALEDAEREITEVLSEQPEHTETHSCDCECTETHESRREWYMKGYRDAQAVSCTDLCVDCPLFDREKHNCPRFNRVIPRAIEEVKPRWIPCEERLPEEQDEYLVTWVSKLHTGKRFVGIGIFEYDLSEDNWLFDDYMNAYVDVTVTAWMPLPEPMRETE